MGFGPKAGPIWWMPLAVFTAPLIFFLEKKMSPSLLSMVAFGWDFFFNRAVSGIKRWEGCNCGGGVSKGLEVGLFWELG